MDCWYNTDVCADYLYEIVCKVKLATVIKADPSGSLFNSYYTDVLGRALLLSLDCSTLRLIHTLEWWVISKEASSTIFWVIVMIRVGIEPRSPCPLVNTLTIMLMPGRMYLYAKITSTTQNMQFINISIKTPWQHGSLSLSLSTSDPINHDFRQLFCISSYVGKELML